MRKLFTTFILLTLLTGCGAEVVYKRGATPRDLEAGKAECKKAGSEIALNKCLEDNGWVIKKLSEKWLSDDDLFATTEVTNDNRISRQKNKGKQGIITISSLNKKITPPVNKAKASTMRKVETPKTEAVKVEESVSPTQTTSQNKSNAATVILTKPNVLDTYVIKSWWKMGGGAKLLEQNINECSAALGSEHHPNKKTFTFTRGFAICMREKGWRGLIEK